MLRSTLLRAALAATALLAGCAGPAPAPKPPVVLVHGAWSEAGAWDRVAAELRARGHDVTAVNLPGHGRDTTPLKDLTLAGYVDAVTRALPAGGRALLVGHSMAGIVISQVAEQVPERVAKLVYVAAYLPRDGESLYQLSMQDRGSRVGAYWRQDDPKAYTPATIAREGLVEVFCADCSAADQARTLREFHQREPLKPAGTPVKLSAARYGRVPKTYLKTLRDRAISPEFQEQMLKATPVQRVVALDSGHSPFRSRVDELVRALVEAARE